MMLLRLAFISTAVLAAALLVACDNPPKSIGIMLEADGQVTALYEPCSQSRTVSSVELLGRGTDDSSGERPPVIWKIVAEDESTLRRFVVGAEPEGYRTEVELAEPLENKLLGIRISGIGPLGYFRLSDLGVGRVYVQGEASAGLLSEDEFRSRVDCN